MGSLLAACAIFSAGGLGACGGHGRAGETSTMAFPLPGSLDEAAFMELERSYRQLPLDDARRPAVRAQLVSHLLGQARDVHAADEYEAALEKLAHITSLYQPQELAQGVPPELLPLAQYIRAEGERRGEEGRVMAALWIERQIHPDDPEPRRQYELVRKFGVEARQHLSLAERYGGLIEVMREHARLTPVPDVLSDLADLYEEYRRRVIAALSPESESRALAGGMSFQEYREATAALTRAPFDIAAVYLRHHDYESALKRLRRLETVTRLEPRVRAWVAKIAQGEPDAAEALLALSIEYSEQDAREVSRALCYYGRRSFPDDPEFPRCLGRLAAVEDDYLEATANYAEAIQVSPDDRALYDEALQVLANLMRGDIFDGDAVTTRVMADKARAILTQRMKRWPGEAPPVGFEDLELAVGLAEMNAGHADEARAHFQASLRRSETTRALVQLGQLEARLGDHDQALLHLQRALAATTRRDLDQIRLRAQILEQVADVQRALGRPDPARAQYAEALALWEGSLGAKDDPSLKAFGQIRRGVLLSRLGREAEAHAAFELAMRAAPDNRETYAQILSHLVVTAPEVASAEGILRRAQRELTLDPEWRTYFALWVQTVCARAGVAPPDDVMRLLARLSRSDAWWGQLAAFGAGKIDYKELHKRAKDRGQRAEAAFYAGARKLAQGDVAGARVLFQAVMDSQMVGFYEYQMSQELIRLDEAVLRPGPGDRSPAAVANP